MKGRVRANADGTAAPVHLYSGPITFGQDGPTLPGWIRLIWEPEPRVECGIEGEAGFDNQVLVGEWAQNGVLLTLGDGRQCLSHPDRWDHWEDRVLVRGSIEPVAFGGVSVRRMRALLVNLPLINRPRITGLVGNGWRLRLKDLTNEDWDGKGFFITGSLLVEREDGGEFEPGRGVAILEAFDYFATLAQGSWATHALPIGTGAAGRIEWQRWTIGQVDRYESGDGWATHYSESVGVLSELWPGFLTKWEDPEWQGTIRTLATLLAEATAHTDGEAALLMIDVVLELLSWAIVVSVGDMVSAEGHDRLQGPDRLRLLLAVAGIDRRIPDGLKELAAAAQRLRWIDGPHAIAQIRDAVVHPRKRYNLREVSPSTILEAQLLARDYAHGAISHLFGATAWKPWTSRW
jgi:hypothetical protein